MSCPDLWMVLPRCAFSPQLPHLFTANIYGHALDALWAKAQATSAPSFAMRTMV